MAVHTYVASTDYDPTQAQFTIATVDDASYLKIGELNADNQALFESIIDGWAGFFQNNQRIAAVRITAPYDATNGVQLENSPELIVGEAYHIRFTQARPGRDGRDGETIYPISGRIGNPFRNKLNPYYHQLAFVRGRLRPIRGRLTGTIKHHLQPLGEEASLPQTPPAALVDIIDVRVSSATVDTEIFERRFTYHGKKSSRFYAKWFDNSTDWINRSPESANAPTVVEWVPPTPVQSAGEHRALMRYRLPTGTTGDFEYIVDFGVE